MDRPRTVDGSSSGQTGRSLFIARLPDGIAIHVPTATPHTCAEPADRKR